MRLSKVRYAALEKVEHFELWLLKEKKNVYHCGSLNIMYTCIDLDLYVCIKSAQNCTQFTELKTAEMHHPRAKFTAI